LIGLREFVVGAHGGDDERIGVPHAASSERICGLRMP
jgi:hypothetical protein